MPGEIFEFSWFRNRDGHCVVAMAADDETAALSGCEPAPPGTMQRFISVNVDPAAGIGDIEQYNPLKQHKCLFRSFAEAETSEEGILAFADTYGMLGLDRENADPNSPPLLCTLEPLEVWHREIRSISKALRLWDMVQAEDAHGLTTRLSPIISWVDADIKGGSVRNLPDPAASFPDFEPDDLRWFRTHPEVIDYYRAGDLVVPAKMWVQAITNRHLESRISPRILWDDSVRKRWSLYFTPVNLIGAIWLQFAQSVTQEKDYRRCRQCESWFEIDHYTARTNRYFCSNACRSKAYRDRQTRARNLYSQGMSLAEIADELGSDKTTIEGWVDGMA